MRRLSLLLVLALTLTGCMVERDYWVRDSDLTSLKRGEAAPATLPALRRSGSGVPVLVDSGALRAGEPFGDVVGGRRLVHTRAKTPVRNATVSLAIIAVGLAAVGILTARWGLARNEYLNTPQADLNHDCGSEHLCGFSAFMALVAGFAPLVFSVTAASGATINQLAALGGSPAERDAQTPPPPTLDLGDGW